MITQELIDSITDGHLNEDALNAVNYNPITMDEIIDEYYDADYSLSEDKVFFETVDFMDEDYIENIEFDDNNF